MKCTMKCMMKCCGGFSAQSSRFLLKEVWSAASMPLVLGCLGLRSALRVRTPAHWSRWVDCLVVIRNGHLDIADPSVVELEEPSTPFLSAAAGATRTTGTMGFDPASLEQVGYTVIQNRFHPMTFLPKTVSSNETFIQ